MLRWAKFAEDTGYHLAMISDHVAITPDVQELFPGPFYDPFISLGWIAAQARKIEIGTTVTILPYRHPVLTARMAANLDQFCGGRFILGVGAGWAKQEFEALDVPFERRGAIANEYLEIITTCWANEVATYEGQFVSFKDIQTGPQPVGNSSLPIWVGGTSDGALRRAVRYGYAWHPYGIRINWLRDEGLPRLRKIAENEGRSAPVLCPRITLRISDSPLVDHVRKAGQGTVDQIRSDLEILEHLGAEYILLDTYAGKPEQTLNPEEDWKMLSLLAEQVLDLENQTLR
jgi:probable F420-dependent oxidoreductase